MTRVWLRWLPAVVVPLAIAAGTLAGSNLASAAVTLPAKTPTQVLAMVGSSTVKSLSGTLSETSDLGLPQLPSGGPASDSGAASALTMLTSAYTAQVYLDGPDNARLQVLDQMNERDVVRNGDSVWYYDSANNTAVHAMLPTVTGPATSSTQSGASQAAVETPAALAKQLLTAIDPSTQVSVGTNTRVAGRTAYDLVLTPRSTGTLVGSVSIAVDSATGLPLGVTIMAAGQSKPAFQLDFTSLSLQTPSPSMFTFTPPAGATVTQQALPEAISPVPPNATRPVPPAGTKSTPPFTVTGTGWNAVVELPAGSVPAELSSLLAETASAVAGGRLLSTSLVNVFFATDGHVYAGSVPLARLQAVADGG